MPTFYPEALKMYKRKGVSDDVIEAVQDYAKKHNKLEYVHWFLTSYYPLHKQQKYMDYVSWWVRDGGLFGPEDMTEKSFSVQLFMDYIEEMELEDEEERDREERRNLPEENGEPEFIQDR